MLNLATNLINKTLRHREWIKASQLASQHEPFGRQLSGSACSNLNLATNLITRDTEVPSGSSLDICCGGGTTSTFKATSAPTFPSGTR
ncbi:hypothetical protein GALMADRAFT_227230 [Galerina marginata CBS 339.88]|uniref:Uncharacterized protein n=1 Tax=Galerina marginata (strain CBS 339.88) TaxID=685588 RepID=A0A067T4M8_GALM3|nr:hypothetical protein GALMADRAFT_227230 [Galerina marginata CBS 339.88]